MSGFSESSHSTSSSSSFGPSTPSASSSRRPSSGDEHSVITPPGSLRDYSASLKARHTLGMAAAMKSMPLERKYDRLRSDDNPFDHLYQSPTPAVRPVAVRQRAMSDDMEVDGEAVRAVRREAKRSSTEVGCMPPFKPALINFNRKHSDEPTPTPGSVASEASFEAGTPDDYFRVYGRPICSYSPIDLSAYEDEAPLSQSCYSSMGPESPFEQPSSRMSTRAGDKVAPAAGPSRWSTATQSTITSASSSNTITSLHSSASSGSLAAQIGVAGTARMSRPSLLRPRPRVHPYESSNGRQRETSSGRGMSFEEESMRQDGRSVSEVMVAMAGLKCQRGRAMRG